MSVCKMQGRSPFGPFDHGTLKAHLLMNGFMDGYTQWISEEEDDDEDVHMAGNNNMGLDKEMTDRHEDDGAGHVGGEESGNDTGGGEDSGHDKQESGHGGEEAAVMPQSSMLLSAVVQDPHVRDLLRKSTTSERAASREEAKLAQLEVDLRTPLYEGAHQRIAPADDGGAR